MNRLILFLCLFCLPYAVFSQGIWKSYTRADGLAGDSVYCINQDKFGNMWFGTWAAGLSKRDTNGVWTNYWNSTDSLVFIDDIEFDSLNNIWLSYGQWYGKTRYGEHIVKFNDSITIYYDTNIGMACPLCLGQDSLGQIWCGMSQYGLACWFDGSEWHSYDVIGTGVYSQVNEIKTDRHGKLYFAHDWGLSTLTHVLVYFHSPVYDLAFDKQNRIWYTAGWDLWMFDGKNFQNYSRGEDKYPHAVAVDSSNNVWTSYTDRPAGVAKFDGTNFTYFNHNDGLGADFVWDIFVDKDGNIWFATDGGGVSVLHDTMTTRVESISEFANDKKIAMFYNYPNPFNNATLIRYTLNVRTKIELKVFNLLGEEVITLLNDSQQAGEHEIAWDGTNQHRKEVKSGIYIAVLRVNNFKKSIKLSLISSCCKIVL